MKVALLGAGRIGAIHAANLTALPGVTLTAVYDPLPDAAGVLAQRHGAALLSLDQIFNDRNIAAVVIATPSVTHAELLMRAAKAGKHIFCEKPVDASLEQGREAERVINKCNVRCMIGFQRRFDPTFAEAEKRLRAGEVGTPEMLIVTSRDPAAPPLDYLRQSGGIFGDMLIHDFDIFRWILNEEAVMIFATGSALTDPAIAEIGDLDATAVTLRTATGRLCQINAIRRAAYGYDQRFEVLGSRGLLSCGNQRPSEVVQWDARGVTQEKPQYFFLQRYREAYRLEIEHFFARLHDEQPMRTSISDGLKAQELAAAASKSHKTGLPVEI